MNFIRPKRTISALAVTVVTVAVLSGQLVFGGLFLLGMDPSQEVSVAEMVVVSAVTAVIVLLLGLAVVVVVTDRDNSGSDANT